MEDHPDHHEEKQMLTPLDILTCYMSEFLTTDLGVPGSIPGHYKKKVVSLERGPLSLVNTTEELLDRKVAATV
jgi:hypothetical protein